MPARRRPGEPVSVFARDASRFAEDRRVCGDGCLRADVVSPRVADGSSRREDVSMRAEAVSRRGAVVPRRAVAGSSRLDAVSPCAEDVSSKDDSALEPPRRGCPLLHDRHDVEDGVTLPKRSARPARTDGSLPHLVRGFATSWSAPSGSRPACRRSRRHDVARPASHSRGGGIRTPDP